jgi:hypothetical protein
VSHPGFHGDLQGFSNPELLFFVEELGEPRRIGDRLASEPRRRRDCRLAANAKERRPVQPEPVRLLFVGG